MGTQEDRVIRKEFHWKRKKEIIKLDMKRQSKGVFLRTPVMTHFVIPLLFFPNFMEMGEEGTMTKRAPRAGAQTKVLLQQLYSQLSTTATKGKGWSMGKVSPIG
jgi:hypothetical protein